MAELPRFYAEAASETERMVRVKEGAYAIETVFEAFERSEGITDDEALALSDAAASAIADDFDWEVLDREAVAGRRVLCRATRTRAVMIAEALNAAVPR